MVQNTDQSWRDENPRARNQSRGGGQTVSMVASRLSGRGFDPSFPFYESLRFDIDQRKHCQKNYL